MCGRIINLLKIFTPLLLIITISLLLIPTSVQAHPLDEYYQVTYITVAPNRINLSIELYPSVLIAPQILSMIDADQDDQISDAEQRGYIDLFQRDLQFEIDGSPIALQVADDIQFPSTLDFRAGGGVIRFNLYADLPADHRGEHQFFYENNHQPGISTYLVNALSDAPSWVQITNQDKDVFQKSVRLDYTIDPAAPVDFGSTAAVADLELPTESATVGQERLTRYLYDSQISPLFMMVVLGVSVVLGGLHALTPGHGKTLVAAYLIGSRGTVKHAVFLGGIVTFTHTASVIIIGLLALLASQFIVPNLFVPLLEIMSGLLVVYLGAQLLWARWQAYRNDESASHSHHHHEHDHSHDHEHHHHHLPEGVKLRDLLTLGVSGGLVPCPEALGVMLIAVGLNRIAMGLGMVVAFSFGLAAVLIVIGVLLVRTKSLLERVGNVGNRWQTVLPLISAIIVTLLGLGILIKGLLPYLNL